MLIHRCCFFMTLCLVVIVAVVSCAPEPTDADEPVYLGSNPMDIERLDLSAEARPAEMAPREVPTFEIELVNRRRHPVAVVFPPTVVDVSYRRTSDDARFLARPMRSVPAEGRLSVLEPGETLRDTIDLTRYQYVREQAAGRGEPLQPWLPAGRYEAEMTVLFGAPEQDVPEGAELEAGRVTLRGMSFVVRRAAAGEVHHKGWTQLFSEADWYTGRDERELVFTGKLERVPGAGGPSIVMRTHWYRLEGRSLYTGGKKVPELEKLVGKKVHLLGKAVDLRLEGKLLEEIWPAAVRPAKDN